MDLRELEMNRGFRDDGIGRSGVWTEVCGIDGESRGFGQIWYDFSKLLSWWGHKKIDCCGWWLFSAINLRGLMNLDMKGFQFFR